MTGSTRIHDVSYSRFVFFPLFIDFEVEACYVYTLGIPAVSYMNVGPQVVYTYIRI